MPITDGRCCGDCNQNIVVPERLKRMRTKQDPRQVKPFHPFPGTDEQVAKGWMNILLEPEGDGAAGYTQPCPVWLNTAEVHNLIVILQKDIDGRSYYAEDGTYLHAKRMLVELAEKLDASFKSALRGHYRDGRRR
jgi:hypothetical protein